MFRAMDHLLQGLDLVVNVGVGFFRVFGPSGDRLSLVYNVFALSRSPLGSSVILEGERYRDVPLGKESFQFLFIYLAL